ncbi:P-loop ATPase, Sll1717 family [Nesterenkonia marinintestina]|uniref:P-loop ATPase, Sll1717 family n=1 Tax=Nesterenkonia marinintestina TaxID=2979865 RepID=UPI0021BFFB84|nr:hypothetical protein [Nesterenkonia sp. GX14115]
MSALRDADLRLGDLDIGEIDAESDAGLDDYFVRTPFVDRAMEGRRTLFLGRKGSGKSALFGQLPRLVREAGQNRVVISITPDHYAWSALKDYKEQGLLAEQAHTNAWKLTLAIEVATAVTSLKLTWTTGTRRSVDKLQKFLEDNFGTINPGIADTAKSILKGLNSFNFSAFGFGVGMSSDPNNEQALTPALASQIFTVIGDAVCEIGVMVTIDRLDDSWDGSEEAKSLLVGLLKASKEINSQLSKRTGDLGLRILVFLRSDIYDVLQFDDKDKHRPTQTPIEWTPTELAQMLDARLPDGIVVGQLFEEGTMRGSIAPFNYIVKRTFLRPREVLQFLDECINIAGLDAVEISKADVQYAEKRYSSWKVDDLRQEYIKVFPDFNRLLECLRQGVHRYDSLDELTQLLESKDPELVDKYGARFLLEKLFEYSVIGVRLADTGPTRFRTEDPELMLPGSAAAYVHQSLHKGLAIVEKRAPASG